MLGAFIHHQCYFPGSDDFSFFPCAAGTILTAGYGTEEELGLALKEVGMSRDEFFITTKVLDNVKDPENALKTSLKKMGIEYVDLYLIHAPFDTEIEKAWPALEKLRDEGNTVPSHFVNYPVDPFAHNSQHR
jgi:aryl-alcohol dehydrogenase-like predicted oxidoreductase